MKGKEVAEMTAEELVKERNMLKGAVIGLGIVGILSLGIMIFAMIKSGKYWLLTLIPGISISLLPATIRLKKLNEEIKTRNL